MGAPMCTRHTEPRPLVLQGQTWTCGSPGVHTSVWVGRETLASARGEGIRMPGATASAQAYLRSVGVQW